MELKKMVALASQLNLDRARGRHWLVPALLGLLLAALSGCGDDGGGIPVSGVAKVDGVPLEKGRISFSPINGTDSPSALGPVKDGQFSFSSKAEIKQGEFKVTVIVTPDKPPRKPSVRKNLADVDIQAEAAKAMREAGPVHTNYRSEVSISDSNHELEFDFESK